jgi:D-alanyl-lipoteichoic acid acyltransferase DltB (MBOAT superfamily)
VTLDLVTIAVFVLAALVYGGLLPARWRGWALLVGSVVAIYRLQPALPARFADYALPTASVLLTVACWRLTRVPSAQTENPSPRAERDFEDPAEVSGINWRLAARNFMRNEDTVTLAVILLLVVGLSFTRFVDAPYRLTASRPPEPLHVALLLGLVVVVGLIVDAVGRRLTPHPQPFSHIPSQGGSAQGRRESEAASISPHPLTPSPTNGARGKRHLTFAMLFIILLFALLKAEPLTVELSRLWRGATGQDTTLAAILDLNWLGFSYIAFRLIHTLRDRQTGLLPALTLREYVTYVIFFPSIVAGPIDRAERFVGDYRALPGLRGMDAARWYDGGARVVAGLFKKFVIADSLALLALNPTNAAQAISTPGLWVLLYGYALRLFFDFSGYSDIAIGAGILFGVRLPENFNRPYLKTNITTFWQSWHMTLSNWARFYVFTPLSRSLLSRKPKPNPMLVVLAGHLATMMVIGLWHGISANFVIWGLWHGAGLFVHKQWSDRTRAWYREKGGKSRAWTLLTWFITFHFVVLGWVWFALPDVGAALRVFAGLAGAR